MIYIVTAKNILPISESNQGISVNFEGDSEDILNHSETAGGHGKCLLFPVYYDEIDYILESNKKYLHWDHESHANPYSKKISKIKVKGIVGNKGRLSAQYFTLKATRKQNTSSVK